MNISTDERQSQAETDTLDISRSLPGTGALNVSDIKAPRRIDAVTSYIQLYALVKDLTRVLKGDLRVKLTIPEGNMGVLAEVCNALIQKLVQFSRWTLYSAEQTASTSHSLLENTIAQVQTAENQYLQIVNAIGSLEDVVSSTRRLSSTLHRSAASDCDLEEVSLTLSKYADTTEASISALYTAFESLHASTIQILQTIEQHTDKQTEVTEDWKHALGRLHLPEEEPEEAEREA